MAPNCQCFSYLKIWRRKLVVRYLSAYSTIPKSKQSTSWHLKAIYPNLGMTFSLRTKVEAERIFSVQHFVGTNKHIRAMQLARRRNLLNLYGKKQHPWRIINRLISQKLLWRPSFRHWTILNWNVFWNYTLDVLFQTNQVCSSFIRGCGKEFLPI